MIRCPRGSIDTNGSMPLTLFDFAIIGVTMEFFLPRVLGVLVLVMSSSRSLRGLRIFLGALSSASLSMETTRLLAGRIGIGLATSGESGGGGGGGGEFVFIRAKGDLVAPVPSLSVEPALLRD